jgi:hypothetical protein
VSMRSCRVLLCCLGTMTESYKESIQVIDTETLTLGGWDALVGKEGVTEAIDIATVEKDAGDAEAL